ncbi:MAG: SOS response-associated peptidase [Reyranellaceae bacterium]
MCANFETLVSPAELLRLYGLKAPPEYYESANLRPDNAVLTIDRQGAAMKRWGLKAAWDNRLIINARSETVAQKASFRPLLERRCLIPATGWFEWQAVPNARRKRKHRLQPVAQGSFCFAGLSDGERVVMLTRAPSPDIAHVHDRMPVVLARQDEARWIDPAARFDQVRKVLDATGAAYRADPLQETPPTRPAQVDLFDWERPAKS